MHGRPDHRTAHQHAIEGPTSRAGDVHDVGANKHVKGAVADDGGDVSVVAPVQRLRASRAPSGRLVMLHVPTEVGHRIRRLGQDDLGADAGEGEAEQPAACADLEAADARVGGEHRHELAHGPQREQVRRLHAAARRRVGWVLADEQLLPAFGTLKRMKGAFASSNRRSEAPSPSASITSWNDIDARASAVGSPFRRHELSTESLFMNIFQCKRKTVWPICETRATRLACSTKPDWPDPTKHSPTGQACESARKPLPTFMLSTPFAVSVTDLQTR